MSVASLLKKPSVIIAMRPPDGEPALIIGASPDSPVGPAVCIGCSTSLDDGPGLALVAHLSPAVAYELASKLMDAAAEIEVFTTKTQGTGQ